MDSYCLPVTRLPGTSQLLSAYIEDFSRVAAFYGHRPALESAHRAAEAVRLDAATRAGVVEVLRQQNENGAADPSVARAIDELAAGAFAVVTGQQVGLLTGPAYTIYKALACIALARQCSERGLRAVPVFWMATEDHDLAEVSHVDWLSESGVTRLKLSEPADMQGRSVGRVPIGSGGREVADRVAALLADRDEKLLAEIQRAMQTQETFASSFARLMAKVFAGRGLILLDPSAPQLHRLAAPLFRDAIRKRAEVAQQLFARGKQLERAGFHQQVKVTESSTPLFLEVEGRRTALRNRGDKLSAGSQSFSEQQLLQLAESAPERFSANALLRPVMQDSLLPTVAYVGGPAEIAYFAQSEVLYRAMLGRMPVVFPRASFTLVEPHAARMLGKYGLRAEDLFRGESWLRQTLERKSLPRGLDARFRKIEKDFARQLQALQKQLTRLDRTLGAASANSQEKILYQVAKLRDKAARAHAFRSGVVDRHVRVLIDGIFPHKQPAERTLSFLPFLARYGPGLLDMLEAKAGDIGCHHVVFL